METYMDRMNRINKEIDEGKEGEYAFEKNPCLDGHPRKEGMEECVIKEATNTSNKSEIGRRCGCSPRTVYRILVEESKQEYIESKEICVQCGEIYDGIRDESGAVVCSNCGWEQ